MRLDHCTCLTIIYTFKENPFRADRAVILVVEISNQRSLYDAVMAPLYLNYVYSAADKLFDS